MMASKEDFYLFAGTGMLLILTAVIYFPALDTGFQLDDAPNLSSLSTISDQGFLQFVLTGVSGPSGRPFSLFTFALQHQAWPADPFAFKSVNLAIHLACAGLILLISRRIAQYLKLTEKEGLVFTLGVTLLWILHPMQITTVLYTVQRMVQLSALFTLLGILIYLHYRVRYIENPHPRYLFNICFGVWVCTVFGVLSKENGILLPLFILVIDRTLLTGQSRDRQLKLCNLITLGFPLLALVIYLAFNFNNVIASYEFRDFTMAERLMTQAVVLVEYLQHLFIPAPGAFSIYHDDYPVSRGLLSPPHTLFAVILVFLLLAAAFVFRRKAPVFALAVFWFFAGHSLESTYLNLELYFEHRNYLPSLGVCMLVVYAVIMAGRYLERAWIAYSVLIIFSLWVVANTLLEINLWTRPLERHQLLVKNHPDSARAVAELGNLYIARLEFDRAEQYFRDLAEKKPALIYPQVKLMALNGCVTHKPFSDDRWRSLIKKAGVAEYSNYGLMEELGLITRVITDKGCQSVDINNLIRLLVTLAHNPEYQSVRGILFEYAARLGVVTGDAGVAYHNIKAAVKYSPTIQRRILELRFMISLGKREEAQKIMARLQEDLDNNIKNRILYSESVEKLKRKLDNTE